MEILALIGIVIFGYRYVVSPRLPTTVAQPNGTVANTVANTKIDKAVVDAQIADIAPHAEPFQSEVKVGTGSRINDFIVCGDYLPTENFSTATSASLNGSVGGNVPNSLPNIPFVPEAVKSGVTIADIVSGNVTFNSPSAPITSLQSRSTNAVIENTIPPIKNDVAAVSPNATIVSKGLPTYVNRRKFR